MISVYPNPFKDHLYIVLDKYEDPENIGFILLDNQGKQLLKSGNLDKYNKIDVSRLLPGIYHYIISKDGTIIKTGKLMKAE